jgi:hypothetical protein
MVTHGVQGKNHVKPLLLQKQSKDGNGMNITGRKVPHLSASKAKEHMKHYSTLQISI